MAYASVLGKTFSHRIQQQPAEQVDKLISRLEGSEEAKLVYWDERSQRLRALSPRSRRGQQLLARGLQSPQVVGVFDAYASYQDIFQAFQETLANLKLC
jgi:RNase H-fold protein (predicted Holliday junction resolvase)